MSTLYEDDILLWSEQQAEALRRRATNEIDWENVAEEIEDVGISETNATLSQIDNVLRHRLYLLGWAGSPAVPKWTAELHDFERQLRRHYRPSMTGTGKVTNEVVREAYDAAIEYCLANMDTEPAHEPPEACPWSLSDILSGA